MEIDVDFPVDVDLACSQNDIIRELQMRQETGFAQIQSGGTSMSSVTHQLQLDRLRSSIVSRFMVPKAAPPAPDDVWDFLSRLETWRQQAPSRLPPEFPQHTEERLHSTYLNVALLLMRPVLAQPVVDQTVLLRCANLSFEACENAKALSLSLQTHSSPIQLYHCFNCGISLLHCLALQPDILTPKRMIQAILACSSGLAIYARSLSIGKTFLELFEKLTEPFLGGENEVGTPLRGPQGDLQAVLKKIVCSEPAEMPR